MNTRVLLLGGTGEARKLALRLHQAGIELIYSIAGIVRQPDLPCEVVSGGFSQFAQADKNDEPVVATCGRVQISQEQADQSLNGMIRFIAQRRISLVLDLTHPYAGTVSDTAVKAARTCGIPSWRYQRSSWQPQEGDHWSHWSDWNDLITQLMPFKRPFMALGRSALNQIDQIPAGQHWILRTTPTDFILNQKNLTLIQDTGPYNGEREKALLKQQHIDVIVCKNSGSDATAGKLVAARALGIPVLMQQRPATAAADALFSDIDSLYLKLVERVQ